METEGERKPRKLRKLQKGSEPSRRSSWKPVFLPQKADKNLAEDNRIWPNMTPTLKVRFRKKHVALQAQKLIKSSILERAVKVKMMLIGGAHFLYPHFSY